MPAPADHRARRQVRVQHPGVLEDVEHRIGDAFGTRQVEEVRVGQGEDDLVVLVGAQLAVS